MKNGNIDDAEFLERLEKIEKALKISNEEKERKIYSFGSVKMDIKSGIKGAMSGKLYEIKGWESSGKSTVSYSIIKDVQRQGGRTLIIDGEHSLSEEYLIKLGIDTSKSKLKIYRPDYLEQGFQYIFDVLDQGLFDYILLDSQDSLQPKKVMEGDTSESALGLKARFVSLNLPKLINKIDASNTLFVVISQIREKIGVMFGPTNTTSGGNAWKFYAHVRIDFSKQIKTDSAANLTTFKFSKNKLAEPMGSGEFELVWGKGINVTKEILELSIEKGIINRSGSWYSYKETKLGQGADTVCKLLEDNEELLNELKQQL